MKNLEIIFSKKNLKMISPTAKEVGIYIQIIKLPVNKLLEIIRK